MFQTSSCFYSEKVESVSIPFLVSFVATCIGVSARMDGVIRIPLQKNSNTETQIKDDQEEEEAVINHKISQCVCASSM